MRSTASDGIIIALVTAFVGAVVLTLLSGCASTPRFLTEEQDAEMRTACPGECVVLPLELWRQIERVIRAVMGGAI